MANPAFRVHGAGCGLADLIHPPADFSSPSLAPFRSRVPGDGGLEMGRVAFVADLAARAGMPPEAALSAIAAMAGGGEAFAPGGPALVSLALASQLLKPARVPVTYYGLSGDDGVGARLRTALARTPLDLTCFRQRPGRSPATHVFSDARAEGGHGGRCFAHAPGVAMDPEMLGESFFQATFNVYAGTALVPRVHAALPALLAKSRRRGAVTVVGCVFDAYAEKEGRPWSLGGDGAWENIDLLVADEDEIRRLSLRPGIEEAVDALLEKGLAAAVVTRGPDGAYYRSVGGVFGESRGWAPAVAELVERAKDRQAHPGDTTGAGDNFLGALVSAFLHQILADDFYPKGEVHVERELFHINPLHLRPAIDLAAAAGGLACLQYGGFRPEQAAGERLGQIRAFLPAPAQPW